MLDVTDNELAVTVRVPEGRWLWLVSLRAGVTLPEWFSLYARPISVALSLSMSPACQAIPCHGCTIGGSRGSLRAEPPSPASGRKCRLGNGTRA